MAKKKTGTYFEKHSALLNRVINDYRASASSYNLFTTNDYAVFNSMQTGITKHPLRYYQMDALYIMDYLLKCREEKQEKKELMEIVDKEKRISAPFLGYEMATGSGKTMLMGASIYFLNRKFGISNFLIITPSSTDIYRKTIRNFETGNLDSVWADDTPFTFNLITGDNYTQNLFFDENKDSNIFIFNISKFGKNATNTELTWESAIWQDDKGNNISIKQFLKDKKLVIITDEAHHAQTPTASKIILNFHPTAVLEFTATSTEKERGSDKKNQTIVYKYDIRRFLEDGHGKLVRAVALAGVKKGKKKDLDDNEKLKLITLLLIHLLKKEAVLLDPKTRSLKPVAFVKVKNDTKYTQKVFDYIRNELPDDKANLDVILRKMKAQELEITDLLSQMYTKKYKGKQALLKADIRKAVQNSIFYHGESDKETEKKFLDIRRNNVEIVVYMQRLDEGIDIPNIYSMAVINDTSTDFRTSVKQIIGRGVRLNKDTRDFDDDEDTLRANSEKLHIVCDQGKNFEEVIMAIQKEFGLNDKYLSFDKEKRGVENKAKSELLTGKYVPHIKAELKAKQDVSLISLVENVDGIVTGFVEDNCFQGEEGTKKSFLKYRPDQFFLEIDVFSDEKVYHEQITKSGGKPQFLKITPKETKQIYGMVQKNLPCLPDTETTRKAFDAYAERLNNIGLQYYKIDDADDKLASKLFVDAFSFYYRNKIERDYFVLDFRQMSEEDSWNLKNSFSSHDIRIPEDQVENKMLEKDLEKKKIIELIESQYHFYGHKKSIYDYSKFDSYTEFQFANYADHVLSDKMITAIKITPGESVSEAGIAAEPDEKYKADPVSFWIKNERQIYFTYGSRKYYPDFILYNDGIIYLVETKGEVFSDTKKNALLKQLDKAEGDEKIKGFRGILVFSSQMDQMGDEYVSWEEFIRKSEDALIRKQSPDQLVSDPPDEEKFIKYIPVYSPVKAYKKLIKKQKTPKPEGWLLIGELTEKLPATVFATQVKGISLLPEYEHNSWVILNQIKSPSDAAGKLALVYSKSINDGYDGNCTIRKLEITEQNNDKLFGEELIVLKALNSDVEPIKIENMGEDDMAVVGVVEVNSFLVEF